MATTMSTTMEFPTTQDWVREKWCKGNGFVIEGEVIHRRVHTVLLKDKSIAPVNALPTKMIAFRVRIDSGDAIERQFDSQGHEKAIKFHPGSATAKGWLPHFDRKKSYGEHVVSIADVVNALHDSIYQLQIPYVKGLQDAIHPKVPNTLEFWLDSIKFQGIDLVLGRHVRFKTLGNSCFVETIALLDDKLSKYNTFAGNNVKATWTEKIKTTTDEDVKPPKPVVDVSRDESEWE